MTGYLPIVVQQQIGRLDVAVHDAVGVEVLEATGKAKENVHALSQSQRLPCNADEETMQTGGRRSDPEGEMGEDIGNKAWVINIAKTDAAAVVMRSSCYCRQQLNFSSVPKVEEHITCTAVIDENDPLVAECPCCTAECSMGDPSPLSMHMATTCGPQLPCKKKSHTTTVEDTTLYSQLNSRFINE